MIMNMVSGGASLNFKIVGGTVQPEKHSENTIWVNTDAKITDEVLSGVEPASPAEGSVWVETGTGGEIVFSAVKNKAIQIHPMSAKQYISGAWVEKTAQIFQGGEWKDWIDWSKWVVKDGMYKVNMVAEGKKYDPSYSETTFTVTEEDGYILFSHGSYSGMVYWGLVDLTNANTLTIEGDFSGINSSYRDDYNFTVWTEIGQYIPTNRVAYTDLTDTGAALDVSSLTGKHYVGFSVRHAGSEKVTNLWME